MKEKTRVLSTTFSYVYLEVELNNNNKAFNSDAHQYVVEHNHLNKTQ